MDSWYIHTFKVNQYKYVCFVIMTGIDDMCRIVVISKIIILAFISLPICLMEGNTYFHILVLHSESNLVYTHSTLSHYSIENNVLSILKQTGMILVYIYLLHLIVSTNIKQNVFSSLLMFSFSILIQVESLGSILSHYSRTNIE